MIITGIVSEDSDDEMESMDVDTYSRKYRLLLERCEILQQDNERIVNRVQKVKKLLERFRKHRKLLMDRLDRHSDNWRNVPLSLYVDEPINKRPCPVVTVKTEKTSNKVGTQSANRATGGGEKSNRKATGGSTSNTKRKGGKNSEKAERDPNAPKRPANPFFQFCQEQRPIIMERLGTEHKTGEPEPSKQELTRQLASKWNTLPPEDKKIYYEMYEKSKEKYAAEMQIYSKSKATLEETNTKSENT